MELKSIMSRQIVYEQVNSAGYATVTPLPGDSDIVIIHGVYLPPEDRGKGLGSRQHKERLAKLWDMGFQYALCTVSKYNPIELRITEKNGWEKLKEFEYSILFGRKLYEEKENNAQSDE